MMHPATSPAQRGFAATISPASFASPGLSSSPGIPSLPPSRRTSGAGIDSRFAPNNFQYNARAAIALVPCALVLLGAGGQLVLGTLLVGTMVTCILDAAGSKENAFFATWGTLLATAVALGTSPAIFSPMRPVAVSCLLLLVALQFLGLCGAWASLQFQWLLLQHPAVGLALERFLFASTPLIAASVQTWGVVSAVGVAAGPFYLMPLLFGLFWLFSLPRPTSFRAKTEKGFGGQVPEAALIQSPFEGAIHAMTVIFLPVSFYCAIHHVSHLFTTFGLCDVLLLFFLPIVFILFASTRGGLWWLTSNPRSLSELRVINGGLALAVIVMCLEVRVVFPSFGHYIHLPMPWNYVFVSLALYGGAAAMGSHVMGLGPGSWGTVPLAIGLTLVAVAASVALGMPIKIMPAPVIAAIHLATYYRSGRLSAYFIFAAATTLSAMWFLAHNFWSLQIDLGGVPVQMLCRFLLVNVGFCLAVPGIASLPKPKPLLGLLLTLHALVVCYVENHLYNYGHDEEGLYPSYLVIVTTIAGVWTARHLEARGKLGPWAVWAVTCLYTAKLAMLALSSPDVLWAATILLMAISPPVLLYRDRAKGASRMRPWQGIAHACVVFVVVWVCRDTVFDALFWWSGKKPTDGLLLGWLVLVAAVACVPLVVLHFSNFQSARRLLFVLCTIGLLFILLQPPVPDGWQVWWDEAHTPEHQLDDLSIYAQSQHAASYATWILIFVIIVGVAGFSSAIPIENSTTLRTVYSISLGFALGVYLCVEHFENAFVIHAPLVIACMAASYFLTFTYLPEENSPRLLPIVFGIFVLMLPVMFLLEGSFKQDIFALDMETIDDSDVALAVEDSRGALLGLYYGLFLMMALAVKLKLEVNVKGGGKDLGSGGGLGGSKQQRLPTTAFTPQHRAAAGIRRALGSSGSLLSSALLGGKRLAAEGVWLPAVGNIATVLCFLLGVYQGLQMSGGNDGLIFFVAPTLLLLNQDASIGASFGDRQRYFPLAVAVSSYLFCSGAYRIYAEFWDSYGLKYEEEFVKGPGFLFLVKNAGLLLLPSANHIFFARFLWDYVRLRDDLLLLFTPLNFPVLFLADIVTEKVLALLGLGFAVVQYVISRRVSKAGLKFI